MRQINKILKDDESLIQKVYQHPVILFLPALVSLLMFLTPFFILYPLFSLGHWGIIVFFFLILTSIFLAVKTFIIWFYNFTLLTSKRMIFFSKQGLFDKKVLDLDLELIDNAIAFSSGLGASIFKYGNIELTVAYKTTTKKKLLKSVPEFQSFQQKILDCVKQIKELNEPQLLTAKDVLEKTPLIELFKVIKKIRDDVGEERFLQSLNKKE